VGVTLKSARELSPYWSSGLKNSSGSTTNATVHRSSIFMSNRMKLTISWCATCSTSCGTRPLMWDHPTPGESSARHHTVLDDFSAKSRVDARINRRIVADFRTAGENDRTAFGGGVPPSEGTKRFEHTLQEHTGMLFGYGTTHCPSNGGGCEMQSLFEEWSHHAERGSRRRAAIRDR